MIKSSCRRKGFILLLSLLGHSPSLREVSSGTQADTDAEPMEENSLSDFLRLLSHTLGNCVSRNSTAHCGLGCPTSVNTQDASSQIEPQDNVNEAILTLAWVRLTIKTNHDSYS